ncbi:hypothetical protein PHIN3_387 [Sinorhizobium phage phiN3]|uniref:Uncharacterized protein n=1 Tax=Sinorhizobium phage phiN3 TaxID=1647405 RepID=A0A0F6YPD1_9CAUD|nr:hypothetical protein AVT40_gp146 [Sinorhizobium phage phiN3]AKF13650.1 hypothetical protein PHIN3_387 [Sinorhizobium phage phiN3]
MTAKVSTEPQVWMDINELVNTLDIFTITWDQYSEEYNELLSQCYDLHKQCNEIERETWGRDWMYHRFGMYRGAYRFDLDMIDTVERYRRLIEKSADGRILINTSQSKEIDGLDPRIIPGAIDRLKHDKENFENSLAKLRVQLEEYREDLKKRQAAKLGPEIKVDDNGTPNMGIVLGVIVVFILALTWFVAL